LNDASRIAYETRFCKLGYHEKPSSSNFHRRTERLLAADSTLAESERLLSRGRNCGGIDVSLPARGLPQDSNQAYFWTVIARASGDDSSQVLTPFIARRLSPTQRAAIEQQADQWLVRRESSTKAAR
jgi:hypothetical protein